MNIDNTTNGTTAFTLTPRIIAAGIIALSAICGSVVYVFGNHASTLFTSPSREPEHVLNELPIAAKDANNNGVPDWQELVSDTSRSTGQSSDAETSQKPLSRTDLEKKYTKTELLAGDLFGVYLQRKEAESYTEADAAVIIENALSELDLKNIPQFSSAEIKNVIEEPQSRDLTKSIAIQYRKDMQTILAPLKNIPEYELSIYARATESNDPLVFAEIATAGDIYATIVGDMKNGTVPEGALSAHVSLMNAFSKLALALHTMSKGYDDVAGSYAALKTFGEAEQEVEQAFVSHHRYLSLYNAIEL